MQIKQSKLLTLSKRFEFSSSRRLNLPDYSDSENLKIYGNETTANFGAGYNFELFCSFTGDIDKRTGMIVNIGEIKKIVNEILENQFDHKFLNVDCELLKDKQPTTENIASCILSELANKFTDSSVIPKSCYLKESDSRAATAYSDGKIESIYSFSFSAARSTRSPFLTDEENFKMFGQASSKSGHGHNYTAEVTISEKIDSYTGAISNYKEVNDRINSLRKLLDHKNLNTDIKQLENCPITTEYLAKFIFDFLSEELPVSSVRLNELPEFFAEYNSSNKFYLGMKNQFNAAHRLHSPLLSDEENLKIYDKCNNKEGHGHLYQFEAIIGSEYDAKSGTIYDMLKLDKAMKESIADWEYKHLDLETNDFREIPSTSENIILLLWEKLNNNFDNKLIRLHLWETNNNKFTLHKNE